ncbi:MAG: hypothetical protein Q9168_007028 [Polycauliona sp. 1 TL-2023]
MMESQDHRWQAPEYVLIEDVEYLATYRPGGYCPVNVGEHFSNNRYQIINKLGFGTYSTVWLAKDCPNERYVALKILKADISTSSNETHILQHFRDSPTETAPDNGKQYLSKMLDTFHIDGPNGRHQCLVSEPAACSIAFTKEMSIVGVFPIQVARAIVAKVVIGLHFLHSSGVVHGDLTPKNILLKPHDIDDLQNGDRGCTMLCPTVSVPIKRYDGAPLSGSVPAHAVLPMQGLQACEEITHADILIADFGEAYLTSEPHPPYLNTPDGYRPPEALNTHDTPPDGKAADIWTLACTTVEILTEQTLFGGMNPAADSLMVEIINGLDQSSKDSLEKEGEKDNESLSKHDNEDIKPPKHHSSVFQALEKRISGQMRSYGHNLTDDEKEALVTMLEGMLTYGPKERWTIEQVLNCDWMEKYGKPAVAALDARPDKSVIEDTGIVKREPENYGRKIVYLSASDSSDSEEEIPIIVRKMEESDLQRGEDPEIPIFVRKMEESDLEGEEDSEIPTLVRKMEDRPSPSVEDSKFPILVRKTEDRPLQGDEDPEIPSTTQKIEQTHLQGDEDSKDGYDCRGAAAGKD